MDSWESRVAKAIALLEFVRDIPRTETNLAAVLYDRIGGPSVISSVKEALNRLFEAKFIRQTEEGFKLQTAAEKSWKTERRSLDPRPRDRADILREGVRDVLSEPALRSYSYKGQKNFLGSNSAWRYEARGRLSSRSGSWPRTARNSSPRPFRRHR